MPASHLAGIKARMRTGHHNVHSCLPAFSLRLFSLPCSARALARIDQYVFVKAGAVYSFFFNPPPLLPPPHTPLSLPISEPVVGMKTPRQVSVLGGGWGIIVLLTWPPAPLVHPHPFFPAPPFPSQPHHSFPISHVRTQAGLG